MAQVMSQVTPSHSEANRFLAADSRAAALWAEAQGVLPGGNTRTTVYAAPHPAYAERGAGCRIVDVDGQERVDFLNNYTCLIHGHAHPAIVEAVVEQVRRGSSFGLPTESEVRLAQLLTRRVPSMERMRFTNSGTEAVMMAIHAARAYTGRSGIAKFEGSYHGSYDYAAVSVAPGPADWGDADAPAAVPDSAGVAAPVPGDMVILPYNNLDACERLLTANRERLAAVIIDPLPNRGGFAAPATAFLTGLRDLTRRLGLLLISDEIISFRVDYNGAQGLLGFSPDLTTLGKIMGGGYPIGCVGGSAAVMSVFDPASGRPKVGHGGTFNANPISMAAGQVAMELMTPAEYDRINALGERARTGLNHVFQAHGVAARATGLGSLFRIVMSDQPVTDHRSNPYDAASRRRQAELHLRLMGSGYLLGGGALGCISTPMTEAEIDGLIAATERALIDLV